MSESSNPKAPYPVPPPSSSSSSSSSSKSGSRNGIPSSAKYHNNNNVNPAETVNPDAATLRDQWKYAIRQYAKWYSHAWGTAIFAGVTFFALGWLIKGGNPIPSFHSPPPHDDTHAHKDNKPTTP
ncbi:hypothetical protein RIF29_41292 [Crotalaria pallida]|uniref:Transmembrane protein n=1 Tax=Crotalaria pallida TaxID=3830 RepID=A0AAN9E4S6_CROPI